MNKKFLINKIAYKKANKEANNKVIKKTPLK